LETWRDKIIEQFVPKISKLSLVSDPDNLITEEKMAVLLRKRGFDILKFNNAVEFRYAYETQYRTIWDKGFKTELVVIVHSKETNLNNLPFDLLEKGKKYYFTIAEIFPKFNPLVLDLIDKTLLDVLFSYRDVFPNEKMGENNTIDFLFRYIFKIDIESINNEIDLLKSLLHIHFNCIEIPILFIERLEDIIREKGILKEIATNELLRDRDRFIKFIIDKHKNILALSPEVQLFHTIEKDDIKIEKSFDYLENKDFNENINYKDWIINAKQLAYLTSIIYQNGNNKYFKRLEEINICINMRYENWLINNYSGLITIPSFSPAMVHHIPHYLASCYRKNNLPIALIVIDGLALNQWLTLRDTLTIKDVRFIENALFAWIPTLTSVSRQSIFSGKIPYEYENSIHTTEKEEKLWTLFWENNGLGKENNLFFKSVDTDNKIEDLEKSIIPHKTKIIGLILNKIDNIMHGMELGMEGFHNQIIIYGKNGILGKIIEKLLKNNFEVWITSDHGNIECKGYGKPNEASIAKSKGERVRIYKSENLLKTVKNRFPESNAWKPIGLPKDYYPLVSKRNCAFLPLGTTAISHGSISIQETVVPFIKVERI